MSFSEAEKSRILFAVRQTTLAIAVISATHSVGKDHSGQFALWDFKGWISEPWMFLIDKWSSNMNHTHDVNLARTIYEIPRTTCKSGEISGSVSRSESHGCCLELPVNYSEARRIPACRIQ